jgi:hypothetical protein
MNALLSNSTKKTCSTIIRHMVACIDTAKAIETPFGHVYLEDVFPDDVYREILARFPAPEAYDRAADRHYGRSAQVRSLYKLTRDKLDTMPSEQSQFWRVIAAALTAEEVKRAMFHKLARDLCFRYRVLRSQVGDLPGYARPTLYRETDGFEIPPHPDTRKKVITMHFYLPADDSQLDLGTALYRRKLMAWPFGAWQNRFEKVKQFPFKPNSAYAFVVNNAVSKKSWHGREQLPPGAGVRNTLLNTYYEEPREGFLGYAT